MTTVFNMWRKSLAPVASLAEAFERDLGEAELVGPVRFESYRMGHGAFERVIAEGETMVNSSVYEFEDLFRVSRNDSEIGWAVSRRRWFGLVCERSESGEVSAVLDFVAPPPAFAGALRNPRRYLSEIDEWGLSASEVPGWMKVELASFGAWDLVADRATYVIERYQPVATGVVMTPESVGVALPAGGEFAFGVQGFPELAEWNVLPEEPDLMYTSAVKEFRENARLGTDASVRARPTVGPGVSEWAAVDAAAVLSAESFEDVAARWRVLAERYPRLVSGVPHSGVARSP